MAIVSYCATCDSEAPCSCSSHRYLAEIVYTPQTRGLKVPDGDERERFDNPPPLARGGAQTPTGTTRPIQAIIVGLEDFVFVDSQLDTVLRSAYEFNPMRVTRLVDATIEKVKAGRLTAPAGYLVNQCKEIGA